MILRVWQVEPELQMSWLNAEFLDDFLEKHPKSLAHFRTQGDKPVITASTRELQAFVNKHTDKTELFKKNAGSGMRKRVKPATNTDHGSEKIRN